jgi:hypothetical protein
VAEAIDRAPGDALDLHGYADLEPVVRAIITHELGGMPYSRITIDEGLRRAGVVRPVETVRDAATTMTGQGAVTVATATAAAAAASPVLAAVAGMPPATAIALILAVTVGALAWVLLQRRARG